MLRRVLHARVPAWTLFYAALLIYIVAVFSSFLSYDHLAGAKRFGRLSERAAEGSRALEATATVLAGTDFMLATSDRPFGGLAGWRFDAGGAPAPGYVLLSLFDGDVRRPAVELVELATGETVYRWEADPAVIFPRGETGGLLGGLWEKTGSFFVATHPLPAANGDLFVKGDATPLVRMSPCGDVVWREPGLFHHSVEAAPDGTLWVPGRNAPNSFGPEADFADDTIVQLSPDGEVLMSRSVSRILVENGMTSLLFTIRNRVHDTDPVHLNDIQPVPGGGPYWEEGDLFLSARSPSLVLLYRPSTDEVLWHRQIPWLSQHDVDVLDDRTISVFSNNTQNIGAGPFIETSNEVMVYSFDTGTVTRPFSGAMGALEVATWRQGLADLTADGFALIEETDSGRLLVLRPDGSVAAEFVNRAADGEVYMLGWSRLLDTDAGAALRAALEKRPCGG